MLLNNSKYECSERKHLIKWPGISQMLLIHMKYFKYFEFWHLITISEYKWWVRWIKDLLSKVNLKKHCDITAVCPVTMFISWPKCALLFYWLTHCMSIPKDGGWGVLLLFPSWLQTVASAEWRKWKLCSYPTSTTTHLGCGTLKMMVTGKRNRGEQTLKGFDPSHFTHRAPFTLFLFR